MIGEVMQRADERRLVGPATAVAILGGAGGAMAGASADALFLAHVGSGYLGLALAGSSLLVAVVLAVVGGLADRVDRRSLLAGTATAAAIGAAMLAALAGTVPFVAGVIGLVVVKQLQAAVDLGFWVVVAERLDARQARRLVPRLAAAQGVGAVAGALLVVPIAHVGVEVVLGVAALCYVGAALLTARLEVGRAIATRPRAPALRGGLATVRRSALAVELAIVVAVAGAFASLAFYTLGSAATQVGGARELAQFLATIRGAVTVLTLIAQVFLVPRLLDRAGVGVALVIAPIAAVAFAGVFEVSGALFAAVLVQSQARLLDAAIETPAEKLALGLVPVELRGRVSGFIDGTAKRAGAIAGGLLAMAMVGWPRALGGVMLGIAGVWLWMAWRLRRRLPALAVAALAAPRRDDADDVGALADPRTVALVERDLAGDGAARASEILVRLHHRRRVDAVPALARAVTARDAAARPVIADALVDCAARPVAPHRELAIPLAAWARARPTDASAEAVVRAAGLLAASVAADRPAGSSLGASPPADLIALTDADGPVGTAARLAIARVAGDRDELIAQLEDALDDGALPLRRLAVREARIELGRALAGRGGDASSAGRRLGRALRRIRGDGEADVHALALGLDALAELALAADRSGAEWLLQRGELQDLARRHGDRRADPARAPAPPPVASAALRLLAALFEDDAVIASDDVRLLVHALGDRDDDVRDAAEAALRELGPGAAGELVEAAGYGRRAGRDRALALLRELPVTEAALDRLIGVELATLDATLVRLGELAALSPAVQRRLEERAQEIGFTALLLLAARHRGAALAASARMWRHAPDAETRARALEILDAALPRATAVRVVGALDERPPAIRAAAAAERAAEPAPDRDAAIRAELGGPDRLSRALVVHALGADGRAYYREAIASAAADAARDLSPLALLRRIAGGQDDDSETDVPTQVETLLLLGTVPLLAGLTTRQLADLSEAARWQDLASGDVVVAAGELLDSLVVVAEGTLVVDGRRITANQVLDDLAVVAPAPARAAVTADGPTRVLRVARLDFEELVDDIPGLAAAICRVLGARARAQH